MRNPPVRLAGAWEREPREVPGSSSHDWQAAPPQAPRAMTMNELIASIAHEVNQPLAAIVAHAEACLTCLEIDQPDLARVRQAANRIVRDGHRASAVLSSLRTMFKGPAPAMSELDLNEVIRDIFDLMHTELSGYDVILQTDLCKQLGCIRGNRIQLQQVLINLIKNAIDSMIDSAVRPLLVRVSTAIRGEFAMVAVEDSGGGFDAEVSGQMFEPFFTTKRGGTGVGLSICRSIVEAHGGVLCAARRELSGSGFRFTVPLIHPPISIQQ
jgi:C4-dicarboxylate-specific signal transduction histidine kinase